MIGIATVLAALLISLLVTRIATIALGVTGLSRESARFQARSAFTGVGFTTSEAEGVVNHPVRRRIVLVLMLLGNAGLVTIVASLLLSFTAANDPNDTWQRMALLLGGLGGIIFLANSTVVDRAMTRFITTLLHRFTDLDVRDYASLLQLTAGFGVTELEVRPEHWAAGRTLEELQLRGEGIAVLGIQRKSGSFVGVPNGATRVEEGDTLVAYGHTHILREFAERRRGATGDAEHAAAVERHESGDVATPEPGAALSLPSAEADEHAADA